MWLERLLNFQKENEIPLDLKFDLHLSIYIKELLKDIIEFQIENDSLKIQMNQKVISKEQFFYWWQITKFNEIFNEEEIIFKKFNEKKRESKFCCL